MGRNIQSALRSLSEIPVAVPPLAHPVVRVLEEGWGGRIDFTDYLLLMKFGNEWKCVAKAYNQDSNTIKA